MTDSKYIIVSAESELSLERMVNEFLNSNGHADPIRHWKLAGGVSVTRASFGAGITFRQAVISEGKNK